MLNFRVKPTDVERIDQAADTLHLSRSDFIRKAVTEAVTSQLGGAAVTAVGVRGKAVEKSVGLDENCPKNRYCIFTKIQDGGTICSTCGYRK